MSLLLNPPALTALMTAATLWLSQHGAYQLADIDDSVAGGVVDSPIFALSGCTFHRMHPPSAPPAGARNGRAHDPKWDPFTRR